MATPAASATASLAPSDQTSAALPSAIGLTPTDPPALDGQIVYSDGGDVYRLQLPSGPAIRLTDDPADEFDPDLSPDGSQIVYRMASGRGDEADIWLMRADGTDRRNLTRDASLSNWAPAWSPDGSRICFNSTRDRGTNRVWLMDPDGRNLELVTEGWGEYCDWSPDGRRIVHASASADGTYDLWITSLVGAEPDRLTEFPGTEFAPAWSSDGQWVAFEQLEEGIWLFSPDGADRRFLGEGGGIVWSPDGFLGFDRPGGYALYDPAARTLARLPLALGRFPSWGR